MAGLFRLTNLAFCCGLASALALPRRSYTNTETHTMIGGDCFDSQANFDANFDYLYPWGNTHNGAARMDDAHVSLEGGYLTLTAEYETDQPDATFSGSSLAINYLSGTVYAKDTFTVAATGGYDFTANITAPVVTGAWPAFWLTAVEGWPPEIDMAEWKGDGKISFNTFNTSSEVAAMDVDYPDAGDWHAIKAEIRDENGSDVSIAFYLDGELQSTQYGVGYVGQAMYFIIDLQMEGSSGSPGPTGSKSAVVTD